MTRKAKGRWLRRAFYGLLVLIAATAVAGWVLHEPRPAGTPGPEADALARRMNAAVNEEAWDRTRAVRWHFGGRHRHLWDRERGFARVRWGDAEVLLRLSNRTGVAREDGQIVDGSAGEELRDAAYSHWVNDSFWLNPVVKAFDEGVERARVGEDELLVSYQSGGLTPGDAYLWKLDESGLPTAWKMWVSIIPIGGVEATWEGWQTLRTGARIATRHEIGPLTLELDDVEGAEALADLESPDPFRELEALSDEQ